MSHQSASSSPFGTCLFIVQSIEYDELLPKPQNLELSLDLKNYHLASSLLMVSRWSDYPTPTKAYNAELYHEEIKEALDNGSFGFRWDPKEIRSCYLHNVSAKAPILLNDTMKKAN